MKKSLWILSTLAVLTIILTGCTKNEVVNEAKEFCLNNWWTHEVQHSETAAYWVCILPDWTECDEWEYFNGKCPSNEESINEISLTIEDLDKLDETNFPKWYTYVKYNMVKDETISQGEETYPEDLSHTLLIPEHATMASREVLSSWIEDWMIYTLTKVTLQDDTELNVLYIVNPKNMNYVAASVENWEENTNYQFVY